MDNQYHKKEEIEGFAEPRSGIDFVIEIPRRLSGTELDGKISAPTIDHIQNFRRNSATTIEFNERSQELTVIHRRLVRFFTQYIYARTLLIVKRIDCCRSRYREI